MATNTKILIIGSGSLGSLENSYFRSFKTLGINDIELFNTDIYKFKRRGTKFIYRVLSYSSTPISNYRIAEGLIKKLKQKKFDLIIVFKGMELSPATIKKAKEISKDAIWANINPDDPFNITSRGSTNINVLNSLFLYDCYFIWSKSIAKKLINQGLKNVEYLPFGYDSHYHHPPNNHLKIINDQVVFIGMWDTQREEILNKISNFNLVIFGNGWNRISKKSLKQTRIFPYNIYLEELSTAIYSSAVSLNIMRSQNEGSHNMRTFEIPAIGGLMLTNRSEEQNFFFKENEACFMYDDYIELSDRIKYIIEHEKEALIIRKKGNELSKNHTYVKRARDVLSIVGGKN